MEDHSYILYYPRQNDDFFAPKKYQQLVEGFVHSNFYVALPGEEIQQEALSAPGISPIVQEDIQESQMRAHVEWILKVYSPEHSKPFGGFTFQLQNGAGDGVLLVDFVARNFGLTANGVMMYENFLQAIRLIYEVYHPYYAFQISLLGESRPITTYEEAQAQQIRWLYDINLFGAELVEKFGRGRVESVPAQKVIPLDDGGVMILPRIYFYPDSSQYSFKQVAAHLGLSYTEEMRQN